MPARWKVRFFPPVMAFIEEGKRRHHSQKNLQRQHYRQAEIFDYTVKLPPRSLNEFSFWVFRFMDNAQFYPRSSGSTSAAQALVCRYCK